MTKNPSPNGCDVVLDSTSYVVPPRCASCGAPKQTTLDARLRKSLGVGGSLTRTFTIPYCRGCAKRALAARRKAELLAWMSFGAAVAFACAGFLVPQLPVAVLLVLPTIFAVGFSLVARARLRPEPPPFPAMAAGDAVRLISFRRYRSVLHCLNPDWGHEFARKNGAPCVPKGRPAGFGTRSVVTAALVAPAAALIVWIAAHPAVQHDRAGAQTTASTARNR